MLTIQSVHFQTNFPCSLYSFKPTLIVFSLRMIILADPVSGWRIIFTCIFETCIFGACIFEVCVYLKFVFWLMLFPAFKVGIEKENPKYNRPKLPQRNLKGTHYCLKKEKGTHFFPKKGKGDPFGISALSHLPRAPLLPLSRILLMCISENYALKKRAYLRTLHI